MLCTSINGPEIPSLRLKWNDEFNGSSLDLTKWHINSKERHHAVNSDIAISQEKGLLKISPITKNRIHYTGYITSQPSLNQVYGIWECKARFFTKPGAWSDFWLFTESVMKNDANFYQNGSEIDIFEHRAVDPLGKDISDTIEHNLHYGGYEEHHVNQSSVQKIQKAEKFHVFTLRWTQNEYVFLIDGKETWRTSKGLAARPLYIIFSVEIRDKFWAGQIPEKGYDGSPMMEIDWVRVYE